MEYIQSMSKGTNNLSYSLQRSKRKHPQPTRVLAFHIIICIAIANQTTTEKSFSKGSTRNPIIPITLRSMTFLRTLLLH